MIPKTDILFESKRNQCRYDHHKNCVIKIFANQRSYLNEKDILSRLDDSMDLKAPKLLNYNDASLSLELEYIEGKLVLELLEEYEVKENLPKALNLLSELINWLNKFYSLMSDSQLNTTNIYGDVNLRNFIVTSSGIVGIDFEQCQSGIKEEEIEYLIAMYMLYNPKESKFKELVMNQIVLVHKLNRSNIMEKIIKIKLRRNK